MLTADVNRYCCHSFHFDMKKKQYFSLLGKLAEPHNYRNNIYNKISCGVVRSSSTPIWGAKTLSVSNKIKTNRIINEYVIRYILTKNKF